MADVTTDVIVIGAGAAGLMAALELALAGRKVVVLEAGATCGGRMLTIDNPLFEKPVEAGAEFIHGDLPVTLELLKKAGLKKTKVTGQSWQSGNEGFVKQSEPIPDYKNLLAKMKALPTDMPVADFMDNHLSGTHAAAQRKALTRYVQGYYAGDTNKTSVAALYTELTTGEDNNYRITGGYRLLVNYLEEAVRKAGATIVFSEAVQQIRWAKGDVQVQTVKQVYTARKAMVTVSVGVLQAGTITFIPALPEKMEALKQLGFGEVVKVCLQFKSAFWKVPKSKGGPGLGRLNFLFAEEVIPTWWTQHPDDGGLLVGWLAGPPAGRFASATKEELMEVVLPSLAAAFHLPQAFLQLHLVAAEWYNWSADPHFRGAYSYEVVGGEALINTVLEPVEQTIYFAGEGLHTGNQIGTVEAALASGRDRAQQLIADN